LDSKINLKEIKWRYSVHRFVQCFLKRHPDVNLRKTNLIKRSRALVTRTDVEQFFTYYTKAVEGIPPENLFNYDETNLRDDPGSRKCIFKKGVKYCERVMNHSKQAISLMLCGSAAGELLPPMVVYRATNLYTSWCERGPAGTVYSCTKSGWFDQFEFQKWFFELVLPKLKRRVGRKMLIGDNLSSHISPAVIDACQKNDIAFVCLPPNATDKMQPLDVAVFAPLKAAWRTILTGYKCQHPDSVTIKKSDFPGLLKDLLINAAPGQHLPAGFKKCGLFPVCPQNTMDRIPSRNMETDSAIVCQLMDSSLGDKLDQLLQSARKLESRTAENYRFSKLRIFAHSVDRNV
jgi:hypothetical protein